MKEYDNIPLNSDDIVNTLLENLSLSKLDEIEKKIKKTKKIEWKTIHIILDLEPKATPRPRYSGRTGTFYVKGAHSNKVFFKKYISDKDLPFITGALKVDCRCYIKTPSSFSKSDTIIAELGYIRPISKPDWDNVGKAYCDMLQGLILYDDSLIVEGVSKKYYSMKPRIEITISYMKEHDSGYNRKKMKEKG